MALIRYPGSKEKLATQICRLFPDAMQRELWSNVLQWEYREPFFGAGAVGFRVLTNLNPRVKVWLNDADNGIVCLWRSVLRDHKRLISMVEAFVPSCEYFYQFKQEDGRGDLPELNIGFRKLALHRMSYSGLGFMSGGPLGGKNQSSEYNVDCRWKAGAIIKDIGQLHGTLAKFKNIQITHGDFEQVIVGAPRECFIYLDPPYYEKGPALYKHSMDDADHLRLAGMLHQSAAQWVLSYDDHAEVRRLYQWAGITPLELTYTMGKANGKRPKNQEVVICPAA